MSWRALPLGMTLLAACATGFPSVTGQQAFPDPVSADLKTSAVRSALVEIARTTGNGAVAQGVYLDTLIGPTPEEFLYQWAHPVAWRSAMIGNHLVDGEFGVPGQNRSPHRTAIALEVGEPFPVGHDSASIIYAWCQRSFPAQRGSAGPPFVWRDTYVRSDTGWAMVGHLRAIAPTACTP